MQEMVKTLTESTTAYTTVKNSDKLNVFNISKLYTPRYVDNNAQLKSPRLI